MYPHAHRSGWRATPADVAVGLPALAAMLTGMSFCDAVLQCAHPLVAEQTLQLLSNGFLRPVLGAALRQSAPDTALAATVYYDACLRTVTSVGFAHACARLVLDTP